MKFQKEIQIMNDFIDEMVLRKKLPFLLESGYSVDSIKLKEFLVRVVEGQYGYRDIHVITHVFEIVIADNVTTMNFDSLHYADYSIDYGDELLPTDGYRINFIEDEEIEVSSFVNLSSVVKKMADYFSSTNYVAYFHSETACVWSVIQGYLHQTEDSLKKQILKWYSDMKDIEYDGVRLYAVFNNGSKLKLEYENLMEEVKKLEEKEKTIL